jgi:hypothetical protein
VAVKTDDIRNMLAQAGSIAYSNTFKVSFEPDQRKSTVSNIVFDNLKRALGTSFNVKDLVGDTADGGVAKWISLMCDEATLPGNQAATGQINGLYTGSGQFNYAHTRMYNDLTLSWIGDANMSALKFINTWMESIFEEEGKLKYKTITQTNSSDVEKRDRNRSVRLNYPDEYTMQISVLKGEKNNTSDIGRPSIRYVMEGAYPYSVDSIPLSFGTTTLVKVTANFYYERWYQYYVDQWGKQIKTYNAP